MRQTADDARLAAAVKTDDGFFATFFVASYSPRLVRLAARTGLSPNQITVGSLAAGVGAAASFAVGSRAALVVGALLLQASFTLDVVDGQLARYTAAMSDFGAWLDGMVDRAKEYAVYAGLAIGSSRGFHQDVWALAGVALVMQTTRHYIDFSYAAGRHSTERADRRDIGYWARRIVVLPIGERLLLISITAAAFRPEVTFVTLVSWGGLATAYTFAGRVRRAIAEPAPADASGTLAAYCDDGLAGWAMSKWVAPALPRWFASPLSARLGFLVPPLVVVAEMAGVLWLSATASDRDIAAGFTVVAVVAIRRYDIVYRQSTERATARIDLLTAGWELRLTAAYVMWATGTVAPGNYVLAGALAVSVGAAGTLSWQDPLSRQGQRGMAGAEELT